MTSSCSGKKENAGTAGALASRLVRVNEIPWQPIRYPGCYIKTLLLDKKAGLLTVLLKMDPGAELPDHEHVMLEQTYVIEGSLVDKEGPESGLTCSQGEFVWRPAGSRHSAWTPEGGLMIAVFQIPNKFYEKDGRTVDLVGDDWDLKWGEVAKMAATAPIGLD